MPVHSLDSLELFAPQFILGCCRHALSFCCPLMAIVSYPLLVFVMISIISIIIIIIIRIISLIIVFFYNRSRWFLNIHFES